MAGTDPDAVELRVLGVLVEKRMTTPDAYPLSLNALRAACNQTTNRDPVVAYDEATIRAALDRLYRRRWTRLASTHGSRAAKFRHLLDEALGLAPDELALLALLMLRGPQTPGELSARAARMRAFGSTAEVETVLERLRGRDLAARLERRPGQKETRWAQRLGEEAAPDAQAPAAARPALRGVDHLDLVVSSLERLLSFYRALLRPLGYGGESEIVGERGERVVYLQTGGPSLGSLSLREARTPSGPVDRYAVGLHHLAFAAGSPAAVDDSERRLRDVGAEIESAAREFDYSPGYYAVFAYDPDGLKLEIVYRPSAGA